MSGDGKTKFSEQNGRNERNYARESRNKVCLVWIINQTPLICAHKIIFNFHSLELRLRFREKLQFPHYSLVEFNFIIKAFSTYSVKGGTETQYAWIISILPRFVFIKSWVLCLDPQAKCTWWWWVKLLRCIIFYGRWNDFPPWHKNDFKKLSYSSQGDESNDLDGHEIWIFSHRRNNSYKEQKYVMKSDPTQNPSEIFRIRIGKYRYKVKWLHKFFPITIIMEAFPAYSTEKLSKS